MITLPTPAEFINGIGVWAAPLFSETLAIIYIPIGIAVVCGLIWFLARVIISGIRRIFGGGSNEESGLSITDIYSLRAK